jgi:hypothetical protein
MASLFQRLDEEEAIVRGELDALREKIAAAEERLARLSITRETARALLGEDERPEDAETAAETGRTVSQVAGAESWFTPRPPGPVSEPLAPGRVEWAVGVERIVSVLATSGRVMRVREIAAAIGEDIKQPTRIETTRSRLKRLAKEGKVVEPEPGLFRIAPASRAGGEAPGSR